MYCAAEIIANGRTLAIKYKKAYYLIINRWMLILECSWYSDKCLILLIASLKFKECDV